VAALERIPPHSSLYIRSQVEAARLLASPHLTPPQIQDLQRSATMIESLALQGTEHYRLMQQVFETALKLLTSNTLTPDSSLRLLGQPLEETKLRLGLEKVLRDMAHLTSGAEKIHLVDTANRIRPRTLF
jgi:serine/threonine-protein kinase PknG